MPNIINKQLFIVDTSIARPISFQIMRGETVQITCRFRDHLDPIVVAGMTATAYWHSGEMDPTSWYSSNAVTLESDKAIWNWVPDFGADGAKEYEWYIKVTDSATNISYRAFGAIEMVGSPDSDPGEAPEAHSDYYTKEETDAAIEAAIVADAVTSVNGQTGAVVLTASDVGAVTQSQMNTAISTATEHLVSDSVEINGHALTGDVNLSASDVEAIPESDRPTFERSHNYTYITDTDNVTKAFDWSGTVTLQMVANAGYDRDDIKAIVLGDKVTTLGTSVFNFQSYLISVDFGEGIQTIGTDAFFNDYRLPALVFPPSLQSIGQNAFANCNAVSYCLFEQKTEAQVKAMPNYGNWGIIAPLTIASQQWVDDRIENLDASDIGAVPTGRTINNKSLSQNVTLTASDVGALPDTYVAPVSSVNSKTGAVTLTASDVGAATPTDLSGYLPLTGGTISGGLVVNGEIGGGVSIYASGGITSNSSINAYGAITSNSTISAAGASIGNSGISANGAITSRSSINAYGAITSNSTISAAGANIGNSGISATGAITSASSIQTQNVRLLGPRFTVNDSGTERDIDLPTDKAGTLALTSDIPTPPVTSVNGQSGAVTLTASDVSALADTVVSSTPANGLYVGNGKLSAFVGGPVVIDSGGAINLDSQFVSTATESQVNADWNATSGVAMILNKPSIPSGVVVDQSYSASSTNAQAGVAVAEAISGVRQVPSASSSDNGKVLGVTSGVVEWVEQSAEQVQADWTQTDSTAVDYIKNKPTLATVATTGSYNDLSNKPTIPAAQVNSDWNAASGVAQILNKPTIPAEQVNSDWNATSGKAQILNKPTLATVATTGAYSDLSGKPTIDATPTSGSSNAVASSGVYNALATKADATDLSGYLPLTGGTISGALTVTGSSGSTTAIASSGDVEVSSGFVFRAGTTTYGAGQIGINNGSITLPSQSGTLALISDIPAMVVSTTWSALRALRNGGNLVPGTTYRITDYVCTTTQTNTAADSTQFDILVKATSANTLSEDAKAVHHGTDFSSAKVGVWELKYRLDNDTTWFAWADSTNGKGVVYYMKDEWNNEAPYDFKNIKFTFDSGTTYYHTFESTSSGTSKQNKIGNYFSSGKWTLPFIVFKGTTSSSSENTFADSCYNIVFDYGCNKNVFGESCHDMTIGYGSDYNVFDGGCHHITMGSSCSNNYFGPSTNYNTLGNSSVCNRFEVNTNHITIGNSCSYNTFEANTRYIVFGYHDSVEDEDVVNNYYHYITVEEGNLQIYLNTTATISSSTYYQNVTIRRGTNQDAAWFTITDNEAGQKYETTYGPGGIKESASMAPLFSTSTAYAVGDYVVYRNALYKCTTAHSAGNWNASHFTQVSIASQIGNINSILDTINGQSL